MKAASADPVAFYKTAVVIFTLIGVGTIAQDLALGPITTRRGRTTWTCVDLALTVAALLMLAAGVVLAQTAIGRSQPAAHEHGATVILLCATGGVVLAKLFIRRAVALGWKRNQQGGKDPDRDALKTLAIAAGAGLGLGAAAIAAVITRTLADVILALVVGGVVTAAFSWALWRKFREDRRSEAENQAAPGGLDDGKGSVFAISGGGGAVKVVYLGDVDAQDLGDDGGVRWVLGTDDHVGEVGIDAALTPHELEMLKAAVRVMDATEVAPAVAPNELGPSNEPRVSMS